MKNHCNRSSGNSCRRSRCCGHNSSEGANDSDSYKGNDIPETISGAGDTGDASGTDDTGPRPKEGQEYSVNKQFIRLRVWC